MTTHAKAQSPLQSRIKFATTNLVLAGASYDIWWTYKGADTRPRFVEGMDEYSEFFRYDEEAHFRTMVVSLYTLFETGPRTANFSVLLRGSRDVGSPLATSETQLTALKPVVVKVMALRNFLFAHRNHTEPYNDVYKRANISGVELRRLIDGGRAILNQLRYAHGMDGFDFNPFVGDHTRELLRFIQPT